MDESVGKGVVAIEADTSGLGKDIARKVDGESGAISGTFKNLGHSIGTVFKTAALAAGAGIVAGLAFAGQAVGAASDLSESMSKVEVVFGDNAAAIVDWSKKSAEAFGSSQQSALEAAGTYGNLFQAFGLAAEPAQEMSTALVELAADLASFNNTSVDEALTALQSGLSGETEPLKRFGIAINDVRMKAEATRLGLVESTVSQEDLAKSTEKVTRATHAQLKAIEEFGPESEQARRATFDLDQANLDLAKTMEGKVPDSLTAAQKAQASYSLIMQDTALAQGDFARTSDGLANQQRIMAAKFTDTKAAIGTALLPVMLAAVSFISDKAIPAFQSLAERVMPKLRAAFEAVGDWVKDNWPRIREVILAALAAIIDRGRALWSWFAERILPGLTAAFQEVVGWVQRNWPTIQKIVSEALEKIGAAINFLVSEVMPKFVDGLTAVVNFVRNNEPVLIGLAAAIGVGIVAMFTAWAISAGAAALATLAAAAPFIAIGAVIAAVVAAVVYAYQEWEFFRIAVDAVKNFLLNDLGPALKAIADFVVNTLIPVIVRIVEIALLPLILQFKLVKATITDVVTPAMSAIVGFITDKVIPIFVAIGTAIGAVAGIVVEKVGEIVAVVTGITGKIAHLAATLFEPIKTAITGAKNWVGSAIDSVIDFVAAIPGRVGAVASGAFDAVKNAFRSAINFIIDGWNGLEFKIPGFDPPGPGPSFGGVTIGVPNIPRLATGSVVSSPMVAVLGESARANPEVVSPVRLMADTFRDVLRTDGGRGNSYTFQSLVPPNEAQLQQFSAWVDRHEQRKRGAA